jgi:hypothetical protein
LRGEGKGGGERTEDPSPYPSPLMGEGKKLLTISEIV